MVNKYKTNLKGEQRQVPTNYQELYHVFYEAGTTVMLRSL
jgi:hypothetical protein